MKCTKNEVAWMEYNLSPGDIKALKRHFPCIRENSTASQSSYKNARAREEAEDEP